MINRITNPGQVLITAPVGGLAAGDAYYDGARFGVCPNDIAAGEEGYMVTEGCFELPFAGGTTPAKNARAFWDPTEKKVYGAWATGRATCGTFYQAAATDDATCQIMLDGGLVDDGENGDITGVTAGTGLSGGGTTGAVTLGVNFGTAEGTVAEGDHSHGADEIDYTNDALLGVTETEGALDAIVDVLRVEPQVKQVVVAPGATSGTSVGDTSLAGGRVTGIVPVSGNDQPVASVAIDGTTGVITLTLAAASTAEATFDVWVKPVLPA